MRSKGGRVVMCSHCPALNSTGRFSLTFVKYSTTAVIIKSATVFSSLGNKGKPGLTDYRFFAPTTRVGDCLINFQRISLVSSFQSPKHLEFLQFIGSIVTHWHCRTKPWKKLSPFPSSIRWSLRIGAPPLRL